MVNGTEQLCCNQEATSGRTKRAEKTEMVSLSHPANESNHSPLSLLQWEENHSIDGFSSLLGLFSYS